MVHSIKTIKMDESKIAYQISDCERWQSSLPINGLFSRASFVSTS